MKREHPLQLTDLLAQSNLLQLVKSLKRFVYSFNSGGISNFLQSARIQNQHIHKDF